MKRIMRFLSEVRWVEVFLLCVSLLLLFRLYGSHVNVQELSRDLMHASQEVRSLATRQAKLQHDARYYQALMRRSSLDSSVALKGSTLDSIGLDFSIRELQYPLVLYAIDPDCPACLRNLSFVNELDAAKPCNTRVIGVAVDDWDMLEDFREEQMVQFTILQELQGSLWELLPISTSPSTVVVGPGGKIAGWWMGELTREVQSDIHAVLSQTCA